MAKNKAKKKELINFNKAIAFLLILSLFAIIKISIQQDYLEEEAEIVLSKLTNGNTAISLLASDNLLEEKVIELEQMEYGEIKNMLGINNDFCIYFEDISGNVIRIANSNLGIGSENIMINGQGCG